MEIFIRNILKDTIKDDIIDQILSDSNSLDKFEAVFTSKAVDEYKNYEFFEQLGDLTINKFIVTYMYKLFPQLRSTNGVGVLASLRILYGSKETLSKLSEKVGFDKFIKCTAEERLDKTRFMNILEDVFEAFFGALEFIIDNLLSNGIGYIFCYRILEKIFNDMNISISYESIIDAKTRLNELKDEYKLNIRYKDNKTPEGDYISELFLDNKLVSTGTSNLKKTAQMIASKNALIWIEQNLGYKKEVPDRYKTIPKKIWY